MCYDSGQVSSIEDKLDVISISIGEEPSGVGYLSKPLVSIWEERCVEPLPNSPSNTHWEKLLDTNSPPMDQCVLHHLYPRVTFT